MFKRIITIGVIVSVFSLPAVVFGVEKENNSKDRYIFERLLNTRTEICRKYGKALDRGKKQLKSSGDIDLRIKNEILTIRAEKDRTETRLLTIAMRHGWDVPPLSDPVLAKKLDIRARELEKVFGMANILVQSELRKDIGLFTANLNLPVQKVNVK